jgi:hypothetical protein
MVEATLHLLTKSKQTNIWYYMKMEFFVKLIVNIIY